MSYAIALRCRKCGREYPLEPLNLCDFCFSPLEVNYDYKSIAKVVSREKIVEGPPSMWRYRDLLPVDDDVVDIGTGFTTLAKADTWGRNENSVSDSPKGLPPRNPTHLGILRGSSC